MKQKTFFSMILLLGFLLSAGFGYAQKSVSGTVTDETGAALPGASVSVKGTTIGTMTDDSGQYSLQAPDDATTLIFSYIGMQTVEKEITGSNVSCTLEPMSSELDEIVVIGYGQVKKEDATGSVTAVSSEDFNQGSITNPMDLISGKTAGVQITSNGGAPGSGSTIRIRGGSSLSASNDPLIVIDGVPIDNTGVAGMRNPLNTINPNDIESFTVLKDASSTAIYGSRASNGVIIITTKKGKLGAPLKVSYNGNVSMSMLTAKTEVLSADEYRNVIADTYGAESPQAAILGTANTDWQSEIFQNAISHQHNVSLSGSAGLLPYRVSVAYSDMEGILKTGTLDRYTGALSLTPSLLNKHLNVNFNVKGMKIANKFADGGAVGSAVRFDPTQPVMDEGNGFGDYFAWTTGEGNPITIAPANPVALLNQRENISDVYRVLGNLQLDYKMHFLPELRANVNLAYDYSQSDGTNTVPDIAAFDYDPSGATSGYNSVYDETKGNELLEAYLNYTKDLDGIDSRLDLMGGYSWQHIHRKGSNFATNYVGDNDTTNTDYNTEYFLLSFYGRLNYTFKGRYLLTATVRNDGTSRFAPENRWGLFPSAALAWRISEESFLKNSNVVSNLKLRVGYGVTGQQDIFQGDYPYLARYTYSYDNAMYPFGGVYYNTLRPEAYNAELKWEETTTTNLALDFGFLKDRINGSVDVYQRTTYDLINVIPVPAGTNFNNTILANIGDLENQGVEVILNTRPVVTNDMFWEVGVNYTYNQNEITKLTAVQDSSYIGVTTGGISGGVGNYIQVHSTGFPANSFYVYEQLYDEAGMPIEGAYADRNEDGVVDENDKYRFEKSAPDHIIGFNTRFEYKNFDFSLTARANIGNYVYNNVASVNGIYYDMYNSAGYLNNVTTAVYDSEFGSYQLASDFYVEDASFLRIDNISIGYNFLNLFNDVMDMRIYATAQNVYTYTKYSGLDPEIFNGIDNNMYPRPRIFMLGLNLDF